MSHQGEEDIFEIVESTENFDFWSEQSFVPSEFKDQVKNADILFVPALGYGANTSPNFPPLTEELLAYFKEHLPADYKVDIAIGDENSPTLVLNSDYKRFGKIVITLVAIPVFVNVFSEYIKNKLAESPKPNITIINTTNNQLVPPTVIPQQKPIKKTSRAPHRFLEPAKVSFTVTVVDTNGRSIKYDYKGPASEVKKVTDVIQQDWIKPNDNK
ncbi:MAG: hypothetical protein JWQ34_2604 [Mucilaginibacter sp.]|uniref:hypothetical protein n=1 Tax=Mucilaginibacter sp. TaxID=1882438 RepID=UPI0026151E44|nr:hypothetical protein [Mucilaginibacter sp.]MDB5004379.1 hypothetical protein [Mucilaginibacter sp.]